MCSIYIFGFFRLLQFFKYFDTLHPIAVPLFCNLLFLSNIQKVWNKLFEQDMAKSINLSGQFLPS